MTKQTNEAIEKLADGIQELLGALNAEQSLRVHYLGLKLGNACRELKHALGEEPVES